MKVQKVNHHIWWQYVSFQPGLWYWWPLLASSTSFPIIPLFSLASCAIPLHTEVRWFWWICSAFGSKILFFLWNLKSETVTRNWGFLVVGTESNKSSLNLVPVAWVSHLKWPRPLLRLSQAASLHQKPYSNILIVASFENENWLKTEFIRIYSNLIKLLYFMGCLSSKSETITKFIGLILQHSWENNSVKHHHKQACQMASTGRLTANQDPSQYARHDICCAAQSSKGYWSDEVSLGKNRRNFKKEKRKKRKEKLFHSVFF